MPVGRDELLRRLRILGFVGPVSGGKHPYMIRGSHRLTVPNVHGSKEIDDALLRRILRQAGVSIEEFDQARG